MIRHTVVFTLKHPRDSALERDFLRAGMSLAAIPGVKRFECLRQVSPKCAFAFGFSMEFASAADYAGYDAHPDHVRFVRTRWVPEVAAFQEIDYQPLAID